MNSVDKYLEDTKRMWAEQEREMGLEYIKDQVGVLRNSKKTLEEEIRQLQAKVSVVATDLADRSVKLAEIKLKEAGL